jgi:hypothetical protein
MNGRLSGLYITAIVISLTTSLLGAVSVLAQEVNSMTFFITSAGSGHGANLGGLPGTDQHCQFLAATAGVGGITW